MTNPSLPSFNFAQFVVPVNSNDQDASGGDGERRGRPEQPVRGGGGQRWRGWRRTGARLAGAGGDGLRARAATPRAPAAQGATAATAATTSWTCSRPTAASAARAVPAPAPRARRRVSVEARRSPAAWQAQVTAGSGPANAVTRHGPRRRRGPQRRRRVQLRRPEHQHLELVLVQRLVQDRGQRRVRRQGRPVRGLVQPGQRRRRPGRRPGREQHDLGPRHGRLGQPHVDHQRLRLVQRDPELEQRRQRDVHPELVERRQRLPPGQRHDDRQLVGRRHRSWIDDSVDVSDSFNGNVFDNDALDLDVSDIQVDASNVTDSSPDPRRRPCPPRARGGHGPVPLPAVGGERQCSPFPH